eukprot:TRINITY_DN5409_c5_g1_i1.p1 TRINITY_DN5409_c5_g1~~TRINITY_DN5409_c5_g1_i1.p1  ORF type:complete len:505 (+),score=83.00 TRINITY_DN5409_c5_g1_i1:527-2041(+)
MKWVIFAICLAWLALADGDVVVLTDDNFEEHLNNNKVMMVKFYAPWCGHCKSMAPEYEKAAKRAKDEGKPYVIAELDCTVHTKTSSKYGIQGFPTVKLFVDGTPIDYEGERKADALLSFIDKKTQPASTELKDLDQVKAQISGKGRRCILVSDNEEDIKKYMAAARTVDEFTFFHTSEKVGMEAFPEITKAPTVVLLRDFDEPKLLYTGAPDTEHMVPYLRDHQLPVVANFDQESVKMIFQKMSRKGVFLITPANVDEKVKEEFRKFAQAKKASDLLFVVAGSRDEWGQRLVGYFGLEDKELPVVEVVDTAGGQPKRFRHKGNLNADELSAFLDEYRRGKIEKFMKSEPVPTENPGPVYKVVGKTFNSEVIDNDMDVMVKFYAEWCGHCKKLAPIYQTVAETLKSNNKLKLVDVDATKNDVEGLAIHSFPTIYFYPAGKKSSPVQYEGERTEEAITKFLQEKATNPIELPKKDLQITSRQPIGTNTITSKFLRAYPFSYAFNCM